jgi:nicotinate-nucleotide pyrophosphorylase (carboxylating)
MPGYAKLPAVQRLIDLALDEDLGRGDVTTAAVIGTADKIIVAQLVAREPLVAFGLDLAAEVFARVDPAISVDDALEDGAVAEKGETLGRVRGPAGSVLVGERVALNFLQRLSGVATLSRRYAGAVEGTGARVVDTRKTTPGYRVLEKAAVAAGGCFNHRFDLSAGVLIKDNHIAACGSVTDAVERARANAPHPLRIEVEVTDELELEQALSAGADIVLLDNMSPDRVAPCARRARERGALVEVSGGITLDSVRAFAEAGADIISCGALTHSAPAVDIALDFTASA